MAEIEAKLTNLIEAVAALLSNEEHAVSCGAHRYQKGSPTDLLWRELKTANQLAARKEQS